MHTSVRPDRPSLRAAAALFTALAALGAAASTDGAPVPLYRETFDARFTDSHGYDLAPLVNCLGGPVPHSPKGRSTSDYGLANLCASNWHYSGDGGACDGGTPARVLTGDALCGQPALSSCGTGAGDGHLSWNSPAGSALIFTHESGFPVAALSAAQWRLRGVGFPGTAPFNVSASGPVSRNKPYWSGDRIALAVHLAGDPDTDWRISLQTATGVDTKGFWVVQSISLGGTFTAVQTGSRFRSSCDPTPATLPPNAVIDGFGLYLQGPLYSSLAKSGSTATDGEFDFDDFTLTGDPRLARTAPGHPAVAATCSHPPATPVLTGGGNYNEGTAVTLTATGGLDPDGDAITYLWSGPFADSAGTAPQAGGASLGSTGARTAALITPLVDTDQTLCAWYQVVAFDGLLSSAPASARVCSLDVDHAPVIDQLTGPASPLPEGTAFTLTVTAHDSDLGHGDALTYAWSLSGTTLGTGTSISLTTPPTSAVQDGACRTFFVVVTDRDGRSATASKQVCSRHLNLPPVAAASGPASVVEGADAQLSASGSNDPDQFPPPGTLLYAWSAPPGVVLRDANTPFPSFTAPDLPAGASSGTLTFTLTVTDCGGLSAQASVTVSVTQSPGCHAIGYQPAKGGYGLVLFEDNWPYDGDLDFNDQVIAVNLEAAQDGKGQVLGLRLSLQLLAIGADYRNGLYLRLPGIASQVSATTTLSASDGTSRTLGPLSGEEELVLELTSDTRLLFDDQANQGGFINTLASLPVATGTALELRIEFAKPQPAWLADRNNLDLFIARTGQFGHQTHLPQFGGTLQMDRRLFGTGADGSGTAPGSPQFVDKHGLPFGLAIPELVAWPGERTPISTAYPLITDFAASSGARFADWYLHPAADAAARFLHGASGAQPAGPRMLNTASALFDSCRR